MHALLISMRYPYVYLHKLRHEKQYEFIDDYYTLIEMQNSLLKYDED